MINCLGPTPDLNLLVPGDMSLNVPIEHDAVQMGRFDYVETRARLSVAIAPGIIVVEREDELPLQLEFNQRSRGKRGETIQESWKVLDTPLDVITFRRRPRLESRWGIDEVTINRHNRQDLTKFARLIGEHSLRKQQRTTDL